MKKSVFNSNYFLIILGFCSLALLTKIYRVLWVRNFTQKPNTGEEGYKTIFF